MRTLNYIKVWVTEPFSGGILKIFDGALRVLPNIYLQPIKEPSYEAVSKDSADYDRAHRKKEGYVLGYNQQDLPYVVFKNPPRWELEGEPVESVKVDISVD
ncbi:hypothetical protein LCGC14_0732880 [marine sediment metagenome]|uniref:Uncharacterized protein n=1 Tax=marine sediment metagenome TaxID=412755 RepID=A0A0F9QD73_9ZZZZ|nr:hypothetical protein [Candidatus Aminicenantes bacterium]